MDGLGALNVSERAQAVAVDGGKLEIHALGRFGHQPTEPLLDPGRAAAEEVLRILDKAGIAALVDAADAGGGAALDLVQKARAGPVGEEAVGAAAQLEQLLERGERRPDGARAGERPIILPLRTAGSPVELGARKGMVLAQQDEGEAFVVAQQDIVGWPVALDQLRLEQQRFGLRVGGDDQHVAGLRDHALEPLRQPRDLGVVGHPVLQRARLADVEHVALGIEHAVDAGATGSVRSTLRIAAMPASSPARRCRGRCRWPVPR
jgi:hypothetical protein